MLKPFTPASDFAPPSLDATDWSQLQPLYQRLIEREVRSAADLERLVLDRSELDAAVSEASNTLYINMTCRTDDAEVKRAYLAFVETVQPRLKEVSFELDRKVAASPFGSALPRERFGVMLRDTRTAVELFRPESIPLETELTKLDQRYSELTGAMTVRFRDVEHTLPQMARYQEEPDRGVREEAWRLVAQRRLQDREEIESIFDQMLGLRARVAANAGFSDFRAYSFRAKRRYDYTPEDCMRFAEGVERHVVPTLRQLNRQRREKLGLERLRPWDMGVDVLGRPPLKPFETVPQMLDRTQRVFRRMDPSPGGLADMLDALAARSNGSGGERCLDLESRKGKAPIGYQANRDRMRMPFIFMNASGVHRDVETMVHEAGHAFHALLCRDDPLLANRSEMPLEFAEVASMSMELTSLPFLDEFYSPGDADRARRLHMELLATLLPWVATIDQFQHWLYTHPGHTRAARREAWLAVRARFAEDADWAGLEEIHASMWQRQGHLFGAPFYYIEYGIAQLGALQLYGSYTRDPSGTIRRYKEALALGASRPLPDLFAAAGLDFDFSPAKIERAWSAVERDLAQLPA
ncbi:MAG: M3 family oligoendopeptidase [Phycisphaerales bacterium]